jgi:hypothetical protein
MGDVASHDEIYRYIDRSNDEIKAFIQILLNDFEAHKADKANPHAVTKAQVGLGSVENYGIATTAEAQQGTSNVKYMTPLRTAEAITQQALIPPNAHKADTNNPHQTTKAQVGLGSVENYGISTEAEARAGTSNVKYMTPLRTSQTIYTQAITPLNAHLADMENPHSTTKAQVGLGSVENYGIATQVEAETGSTNLKYMTPLRTLQAIKKQVGDTMANHIADVNNPHQTTKAQVGLGSVENYPVATTAEAQAGVATNKYTTPFLVKAAIDAFAGNMVATHEARKDNPHQVTKAQVGLGSVLNYGVADWSSAVLGQSNVLYMTPYLVREAMNYAVSNGLYDGRYVLKNIQGDGNIHVRTDLGTAYVWINGAWRQFWPPQWQ